MAWDKKVPFDKDGNLMHFAGREGSYNGAAEWRDAEEFFSVLYYHGYSRGRSAANMQFKDQAGHEYTMFFSDFDKVVKFLDTGALVGTFVPVKRGMNYGVKMVTSDE